MTNVRTGEDNLQARGRMDVHCETGPARYIVMKHNNGVVTRDMVVDFLEQEDDNLMEWETKGMASRFGEGLVGLDPVTFAMQKKDLDTESSYRACRAKHYAQLRVSLEKKELSDDEFALAMLAYDNKHRPSRTVVEQDAEGGESSIARLLTEQLGISQSAPSITVTDPVGASTLLPVAESVPSSSRGVIQSTDDTPTASIAESTCGVTSDGITPVSTSPGDNTAGDKVEAAVECEGRHPAVPERSQAETLKLVREEWEVLEEGLYTTMFPENTGDLCRSLVQCSAAELERHRLFIALHDDVTGSIFNEDLVPAEADIAEVMAACPAISSRREAITMIKHVWGAPVLAIAFEQKREKALDEMFGKGREPMPEVERIRFIICLMFKAFAAMYEEDYILPYEYPATDPAREVEE
jgi:hypothetical protein